MPLGEILSVLGGNPAVQSMRTNLAQQKAKLDDRIQKLTADIQDLTAKKALLLAKYTEEYKEVIAVNEEIKKREDILTKTQADYSTLT